MFSSIRRNLLLKSLIPKRLTFLPSKGMKLLAYQAAQLLKKYEVPVLYGDVAFTPEEAKTVADSIIQKTGKKWLLKAQIHPQHKEKGYFTTNKLLLSYHIIKSPEEAKRIAETVIGFYYLSKEYDQSGMKCDSVYIYEILDIEREIYSALFVDRDAWAPVLLYSPEGGMNIEDIAEDMPEKIFTAHVKTKDGFTEEQLEEIVKNLSLENHRESTKKTFQNLYKCYKEWDLEMIEINPMVVDKKQGILCIENHISIDDNAIYRQPALAKMKDTSGWSKNKRLADKYHFNYVPIGGNIGCLVNGTRSDLATMDIIMYHGGYPANFFKIGSDGEQMKQAIHLVCHDPAVDVVYMNIFGRILRCDLFVESMLKANKEKSFSKPIVLRLNGNKAEEAIEMLKREEDLIKIIHLETDLDSSAQLAVKMAKRSSKN